MFWGILTSCLASYATHGPPDRFSIAAAPKSVTLGCLNMECRMRGLTIIVTALVVAGTSLVFSSREAGAWPSPGLSNAFASSGAVETIGWRRYCRRYGCGPDIVAPDVQVDVDVAGADADVDADVSVDVDVPAVVVLPPPRPLSCGQYRYWNGTACVDARYHDPYIGPR
jgi:hypothetical protein